MEGKARIIFPITMAFFMAFLMTAVVTFLNLGPTPEFFWRARLDSGYPSASRRSTKPEPSAALWTPCGASSWRRFRWWMNFW